MKIRLPYAILFLSLIFGSCKKPDNNNPATTSSGCKVVNYHGIDTDSLGKSYYRGGAKFTYDASGNLLQIEGIDSLGNSKITARQHKYTYSNFTGNHPQTRVEIDSNNKTYTSTYTWTGNNLTKSVYNFQGDNNPFKLIGYLTYDNNGNLTNAVRKTWAGTGKEITTDSVVYSNFNNNRAGKGEYYFLGQGLVSLALTCWYTYDANNNLVKFEVQRPGSNRYTSYEATYSNLIDPYDPEGGVLIEDFIWVAGQVNNNNIPTKQVIYSYNNGNPIESAKYIFSNFQTNSSGCVTSWNVTYSGTGIRSSYGPNVKTGVTTLNY